MGYTHYWENYAHDIPPQALAIIRQIVFQAYRDGIIQYESDMKKEPVVTNKLIRFNGIGENGHETFSFDVEDGYRTSEGKPFDCCKTAQRPYDDIVMKVLIVLKHYLKDQVHVSSDGSFGEEWHDARREMESRFGIRTYEDAELAAA
jgi:hypothetical protein